jgi:hypothetical protein
MIHWSSLSPDVRELLRKLVEGCCDVPAGENLATLLESGLVERSEDRWQPTQAGRSAYVIRDDPGDYVLPLRRRWWVSAHANKATPDAHHVPTRRERVSG